MEIPQRTKIRTTTWPSNPTPWYIPGEIRNSKDTCPPMFIAALLTITSTLKQIKCPSTEEWMKMWCVCVYMDFPGGSDGKASAYNVGDPGSIPGSGGSSGEGNGNPLQYSCLENPMDREA